MITHNPNRQYIADLARYSKMKYPSCGKSGLRLPLLSLGLWQNFGESDSLSSAKSLIHHAFDSGITHFDLANNYGPPYGAAELTFGRVMEQGLTKYRDELLISSKAGYDMWPGPYGVGGSRKYLIASCEQSLKRTGLEYFDIFYSHKPDPDTPLEETMLALDHLVRSGKALYIGLSNYGPHETKQAISILKILGTPLLIHQPRYNMFDRWIEDGLTELLDEAGGGSIVFSPLSQGLLTDKYLHGIPVNSRAAKQHQVHLNANSIGDDKINKFKLLNNIAQERGQTLAQMAIAWVLNNKTVTSALIVASKVSQIDNCVGALSMLDFSEDELSAINTILERNS
ncbi:MAG: aldo/keto reductase [Lentisphaeraceae bacterium]|nr:aldo/keto reductase [Lentisphaeraceae bacterium]